MPLDLNTFAAKGLNFMGARPTLFEVILSPPAGLADSNFNDKHSFLIKAASLPESSIGVVEVPYFGRKIRYPGDRTYGAWAVSILNDEDFTLRKFFERWHATVNSVIPNVMEEGTNSEAINIKGSAIVNQYSKAGPVEGKIIRSYFFSGLWPMDVDAIGVDWGQNDRIEEYNVKFSYDYWLPTDGNTSGVPADFQ